MNIPINRQLFMLENRIKAVLTDPPNMSNIADAVNDFTDKYMPQIEEVTVSTLIKLQDESSTLQDVTFEQLVALHVFENKNDSHYEMLTHEEFWNSNPAPGTEFYEHSSAPCRVVAGKDYTTDYDPDDVLMVQLSTADTNRECIYIVTKWGDWDSEDGRFVRRNHAEGVQHGVEEFNEKHECSIGFTD